MIKMWLFHPNGIMLRELLVAQMAEAGGWLAARQRSNYGFDVGVLPGFFPSTAQVMSWLFSSLTRRCATMVRVTCPSRAKTGWFRIPFSHVQPLRISVGLACALGVCARVCGGVSYYMSSDTITVIGVLRDKKMGLCLFRNNSYLWVALYICNFF
jgi:hypothetical protein